MAVRTDKDVLRLRRAVMRAEQILGNIDRSVLAPARLCGSDLGILERLSRKGARPVNGLAGRVGLTSGSTTTAVQRLRRRGLVETRRGLEDKRVVWVSCTEEGTRLARSIGRSRRDLLEDAFGALSGREREVLTALLKRLCKNGQLTLGGSSALAD